MLHKEPIAASAGARPAFSKQAKAYYELSKPTIILLILIATYCSLWLASDGAPGLVISVVTVLGSGLAAASANAFNNVYDRDIDQVMRRTRSRPIPSGRVTPRQALIFGIITGAASFGLLYWQANLLTAAIALAGNMFYVFVYTMWLKRSTPQNIVIGGAAGSIPPLIAWAAVTGSVTWPAIILFAVIFLWTPPHFWALALFRSEDYAQANVPMMPVVRGQEETKRQIIIYTAVLTVVSLTLVFTGIVGWLYFLLALALGAYFTHLALLTAKDKTDRAAKKLFGYSIIYLALVFLAAVIDNQLV